MLCDWTAKPPRCLSRLPEFLGTASHHPAAAGPEEPGTARPDAQRGVLGEHPRSRATGSAGSGAGFLRLHTEPMPPGSPAAGGDRDPERDGRRRGCASRCRRCHRRRAPQTSRRLFCVSSSHPHHTCSSLWSRPVSNPWFPSEHFQSYPRDNMPALFQNNAAPGANSLLSAVSLINPAGRQQRPGNVSCNQSPQASALTLPSPRMLLRSAVKLPDNR